MSWRRSKLPILGVAVAAAWFVVHVAVTVGDGLRDDVARTDVGVVLGNKVELDGQPSDRLRARLDRALELYDDGHLEMIIVSGGTGVEGFDEAEVMRTYLEEHGVPADRIVADSDGYTTWMTAQNAVAIAEEHGLESVTVITQYHHISRAKLAFRKAGFEEVGSAHARIFEWRDLYSIGREFAAYYRYALR
jgi:vancomycin permeability regulator SanA